MMFPLAPPRISAITGSNPANVAQHWPLIERALDSLGQLSTRAGIAAIATIRVECPPFKPIHELGDRDYFVKHYWQNERVRKELGNLSEDDAVRFAGRGFIQITGRNNYKHYGYELGIDLLADPDFALEPNTSAAIFAVYFKERNLKAHADAADWTRVRELVNGGHNQLAQFISYANHLESAINAQHIGAFAGM
jgi:uncharacterized protein YjiS (DUF1127 family)